MAADVQEGVHAAVAVAGQKQGQAGEVAGQEGVRPGQFAAVGGDRGQGAEHRLPLPRETLGAGVTRNRRGRDRIVQIEGARLAQAGELFEQFEFRPAIHGIVSAAIRRCGLVRRRQAFGKADSARQAAAYRVVNAPR